MITTIMTDNTCCRRCDHRLRADAIRALDEGGPDACTRCGLGFDFAARWLAENGYDQDDDQ